MRRRPRRSTLFPSPSLFRSFHSPKFHYGAPVLPFLVVAAGAAAGRLGDRVRGTRLNALLLAGRSEEHTSEPQSRQYLVCRLLPEKKTVRVLFPSSPASFPAI